MLSAGSPRSNKVYASPGCVWYRQRQRRRQTTQTTTSTITTTVVFASLLYLRHRRGGRRCRRNRNGLCSGSLSGCKNRPRSASIIAAKRKPAEFLFPRHGVWAKGLENRFYMSFTFLCVRFWTLGPLTQTRECVPFTDDRIISVCFCACVYVFTLVSDRIDTENAAWLGPLPLTHICLLPGNYPSRTGSFSVSVFLHIPHQRETSSPRQIESRECEWRLDA